MTSNIVTIPGYETLEPIYTGPRTLVYRGTRIVDQKSIIIKLLRNEYPSFHELVQFHNQYTIAKNLDLPGVIQPLALLNYCNSYALIMEFGGISLKEWGMGSGEWGMGSGEEGVGSGEEGVGNGEEGMGSGEEGVGRNSDFLSDFLHIAIQIVVTLDGLYRHRVIHKDIKPSNIVINPVTKEVKLIDFSIASLLPRETQTLTSPKVLEGTLAYISPEQTGRMNRLIDYRTDFYSLGVTFYELLTGQLPFTSVDPMELVHCHIAKEPPKVHTLNSHIPPILSEIVSKLMAKNAEDRYQSALGLKYDLEICLQQWQTRENIPPFKLASRDISDRFIIPEKLYGRAKEVETLLAAFDRVSGNRPEKDSEDKLTPKIELILVAGFSGIGKTAVVNEVHKPIVRAKGYFIKGKFDQFQRNIPFSGFVQALQNLMRQLLTETDAQIEQWKAKIMVALGDQARVIIEVIPELERIIGKQPAISELSGSAAQNRFNLLFVKFIQVFTTIDHPLVIFLDDLQWADSASLKLMQLLMSEKNSGYLLLIGAYRDNEVSAAHPLMLTLDEIRKAEATLDTITLAALNQSDLNHLIADTLSCSPELAAPLTTLVHCKTKGNPFFTNQFLKSLHEDGLITFNFEAGYWQCDIAEVKALSLTDDVVEFMALQLQKLPDATQEVLKLAACIGNSFDLATLAIVYEKSPVETAADLWKALQEELVIPTSEVYKFYQDGHGSLLTVNNQQSTINNQQIAIYKFLHDRVQQAAYSLIPEEQKQSTHLKIGQLLLRNTTDAARQETIFEIVNQLNIGVGLISDRIEKDELAQLNLMAGRKAKASTAYAAAIAYLYVGMELLAADSWHSQYDLTLGLHLEAIETEYLNAHFEQSANLAEIALQNCKTLLHRIAVYQQKIQFFTAQNQMPLALSTGLESLELMGFSLVPGLEVGSSVVALEDLEKQPVMSDPHQLAAMRILVTVTPAAFMASPTIYSQVIFTMIHLCQEHGYSAFAASAYSQYGVLLSGVMGDIEAGYHSGKVALKILELFGASVLKCQVYLLVYGFIRPWKEKFRASLAPLLEALQSGLERGDIEFAGYCTFHYGEKAFADGEPLHAIAQKLTSFIELMEKFKQEFSLYYDKVWHQMCLNLQGLAEDKCRLVGDSFDESEMLPYFHKTKNGTLLFATYTAKLTLFYLFQDNTSATECARLALDYAKSGAGMMTSAYHNFYSTLALLALYPYADSQQQNEYMKSVEQLQYTMQRWADHAPMNFLNKFYLVEAEKHRVLGEYVTAMEAYDRAIALAKENEYIHEEALAYELAGRFYLDWGKQTIAQTYLTGAYYGYARWGALAKVEDLEQRYPELLAPIIRQEKIHLTVSGTNSTLGSTNSSGNLVSDTLDLITVVKASQTLACEIHLDKLLSTLMQVVMENAGADAGALILLKDENWVIEASAKKHTKYTVLQSLPVEQSEEIPVTAINYVKRTGETLVINDDSVETSLGADPYIIRHQPKSLLCTPMINQGKLIGILYLENNLTRGAFSSDRLEILKLLCSQAAISLENATFCNTLEQKVTARTQELSQALEHLKATQKKLVESEKMAALGSLVAGVAHEINTPIGTSITAASTLAHETKTFVNEVAQGNLKRSILQGYVEVANHSTALIVKNLHRAGELIQSFKQVAVDQTNLEQRTFAVKPYIEEILLSLAPKLKQTPHTLTVEGDETISLNSYPGALAQIITNITVNSLLHAYQPHEVGQLHFKVQQQGEQVIIQYSDDGCGISQENLSKIFEPFFTTARNLGGTGLGLHIVYNLVTQKLGGTIDVKSQTGVGTIFIMRFPLSITSSLSSFS
ncbi:MAG: AAA family ATPase [Stigonema ocellatum SAG 48.90 = DSM 106950]|nr:AAA family ATPase [Stigonema ocellatum SAG 48.90 = DSM 106950]